MVEGTKYIVRGGGWGYQMYCERRWLGVYTKCIVRGGGWGYQIYCERGWVGVPNIL